MTENFEKILNPGSVRCTTGVVRGAGMYEYAEVFVKVKYENSRLSITGVVGPKQNGNCVGGCGQIDLELDWYNRYWTADLVERLRLLWERWHLNDTRAGCEHQRASWDTKKQIEVVAYKLTHEAMRLRDRTLKEAASAALAGELFNPTPTARALAEMKDWFQDRYEPPDADSPLSGCYEVSKRETKKAGWVYPKEHPDGLLAKPCEVCGYAYGSRWLFEAVPEDVLAELRAMPETEKTPAWV